MAVSPQSLSWIDEAVKFTTLGTTHFHPVLLRVKEPILLPVMLRLEFKQRNIHNIHHPGVATILILALMLGNFLAPPGAHGSDPTRYSTIRYFLAGDTPATELPRIRKANDAFNHCHIRRHLHN